MFSLKPNRFLLLSSWDAPFAQPFFVQGTHGADGRFLIHFFHGTGLLKLGKFQICNLRYVYKCWAYVQSHPSESVLAMRNPGGMTITNLGIESN